MSGRDLLFEIGTEELPSSAVYTAIQQLNIAVPKALDDARLQYEEIEVLASPRRIAVFVSQLVESQPDATVRHKGPAAKAAFDADGNPTKAAEGFARGKGVPVTALEVVDEHGAAYVYATVEIKGVSTLEVLPTLLADLAEKIEWPKSMRWGSGDTKFSRPVRWLTALFGTDIVPVEFGGLVAGRTTRGHRFLHPEPVELLASFEYRTKLEAAKVVVDQDERARVLQEGIETIAGQLGGTAVVPEKTLAEVVNLVEWPTVAAGTFDESFLEVPREILENAMGSHQRYFPVERTDGSLDNRFIVAHNGAPERTDAIISGHQRVIRARLADAAFFYREDLGTPLEGYLPRLETIVFQEKLGTLADKVARVESLADKIATLVTSPSDERAWALRAAHLAKADLVTSAVVEFTDLQGTMGRYYAGASGESPEVALAIEEHYRPRGASDSLPSTLAGRIVAIADKLDTICGIFAAGMAPTGSADPFALRRNANGILQIALDGTEFSLAEAIGAALEPYGDVITGLDIDGVGSQVMAFFVTRFESILRDRGHAYDTVGAVLSVSAADPGDALLRAEALTRFRAASDDMEDLSVAFTRAKNLAKPELGTSADRTIMGEHETALADALDDAEKVAGQLVEVRAYGKLLEVYAGMRGPIDSFFDNVMVMDDDPSVRDNRLRLLNRFVALFSAFADFSKLAG